MNLREAFNSGKPFKRNIWKNKDEWLVFSNIMSVGCETDRLVDSFPYRGNLVCSNLKVIGPNMHNIMFAGVIYSGMSGGPVLDIKTKQVYAVNYAVHVGFVSASPVVNMLDYLGL